MRRRPFLLAAGALALAACAGVPLGLEAPRVSLADIGLAGGGLLEQRFRLTLRVHNPNDRDIPIDGLAFAVELNGVEFAQGASNRPVLLQRLGDTLVEVEGVTNLLAVFQQLRALRPGPEALESLPYRLHGKLHSGGVLGAIPFDRRGEIALPEELGGPRRRGAKPRVEPF
jgi:LEA14-like dessication related protein